MRSALFEVVAVLAKTSYLHDIIAGLVGDSGSKLRKNLALLHAIIYSDYQALALRSLVLAELLLTGDVAYPL